MGTAWGRALEASRCDRNLGGGNAQLTSRHQPAMNRPSRSHGPPFLGTTFGGFPLVLPPTGVSVAFEIPPGLAGFSIISQGISVNGGPLYFTDAHETVLH